MYYDKRYLQFNDLVFDGYDMISDYDESLQYKGSSIPFSYGHGSYRPFKSQFLYVSERSLNMTITLKLKKIPCEYRGYYVQFAEQELGKPGRLWAIKNNEIIWATAAVNSIRPVHNGKKYEVVYDVEFVIPGGVWHKADKQRTFVLPYDVCSLMDCKGFEDYDPCKDINLNGDCCVSCMEKELLESNKERCDCCCDSPTEDMALCYHTHELQSFYSCDTPYQLVYDCQTAEKYNREEAFGQKLCVSRYCDDTVISGRFYANTDIETDGVILTLVGDYKNPWIKINGNLNVIEGEYSGKLTIYPNGDIYYQKSECCEPELLSLIGEDGTPRWVVPEGEDYGWMIQPGRNSIVVYTNACCSQSGRACVYIDVDGITV